MRKLITGAVAAAFIGGPVLTGLMMAAPAGAATAVPANSTPSCQSDPQCFEPVVAISQSSGTDFTPADDAALSVLGTQVGTRIRNSLGDGSQDWRYEVVGFVPASGNGGLGFTAFDNSHWAGQPIVQVQVQPFGNDNGECANLTRNTHLGVVQDCGTGKGQLFILSHTAPGQTATPPGYRLVISVRQANTLQHHLELTAQTDGFGQVFGQRGINNNHAQMWSALP